MPTAARLQTPNATISRGTTAPKYDAGVKSYQLPFPNAPHDGGPQDLANTKAITQQQAKANSVQYAIDNQPTWIDKLALMTNVGLATAGAGAGLGISAGAFGGGTAGSIGAGAATGAVGGAVQSALAGGKVGKNILTGAALGGVAGGIKPLVQGAGITGMAGKVVSGLGAKFLGGAVSGAINGGSSGGAPGRATTGSNFLGAGLGAAGAFAQGNNGNMAGTDTSLAGTITGALPGILQAGATAGGALAGSNARVGADENAITTQKSTLGNIGDIWKTQQGLGQGADTALGTALGTNGKPADYSGFENMPGYQFAVKQGTQAIQRQAASMGNAYTPNTSEAVGQYVTGTAMQDYNTYISQLMGAAGLGNSANTGIANPTMATGENISQLQQNIGNAKASAFNASGTAASGLFSPNGAGTSLIGAAGQYLNGGGGSSGSGGSGGGSGGGASGGKLFNGPLSNWNNTGAGNGTWGSGYDPTTGGSWVGSGATDIPSFNSSDYGNFGGSLDYGNTPSFDTGGMTDFGGGLDYGAGSGGMDFLGGWG